MARMRGSAGGVDPWTIIQSWAGGTMTNATYTRGPSMATEGNIAFIGGVLLPSGKVVLVPSNADYVGIYDPVDNTLFRRRAATVRQGGSGATQRGLCRHLRSRRQHLHQRSIARRRGRCLCQRRAATVRQGGSGATLRGLCRHLRSRRQHLHQRSIARRRGRCLYWRRASPVRQGGSGAEQRGLCRHLRSCRQHHGEGNTAFFGGVLLPSGKVVLVPANADYVGIVEPQPLTAADTATCESAYLNKF